MQQAVFTAGLACLIGATAGGGLKAFGIEIPLLRTFGLPAMGAGTGRSVKAFVLGAAPTESDAP